MEKSIKGFLVDEGTEIEEAITAWRLDDIQGFARFLEHNIEPGTEMKLTYKEFTPDEWKKCELLGKVLGGEDLTQEEEALLDADAT